MVFSSIAFLLSFFMMAIIYYFSHMSFRKGLLVLFNTIFYLLMGIEGYIYLLLITLISYLIAKLKKVNLTYIFIIIILLFLAITKYFNNLNIIIPVGISFFTFKIISYLLDIKNNKYEAINNFFDYYNYVFFFAQIMSGPIERCNNFIKEINNLDRQLTYEELRNGFIMFILGLFEKIIISSRLSIVANNIFESTNDLYGIYILLGIFLYGLQIYTDFDSYSNMAIGLAKMLGINTIRNFNVPYLAKNLSDFWKRWHISLSSWLKDYIYIPLGGNRKGTIRRYINVMIVSLASGIWHGNSANFVMWGALHGIGQIVANIFHINITNKIKVDNKLLKLIGRIIGIIITFIFVNICWLFFKLDFNEAIICLKHLFIFDNFRIDLAILNITYLEYIILWLLIILLFISDLFRYFTNGIDDFGKLPFVVRWIVYFSIVFLFVFLFPYGGNYVSDFIYSNF